MRTPVAPDAPEDLAAVVLGASADGTPILLGDVATIRLGLRKRSAMAMTDASPSMVLLLWREAGSNVLEVTERIKEEVAALQESHFAREGSRSS
ncbi:MAG: efflux RND transporter permease subunit [Myxococcales bacterium]|nr:efflux RND transporter permease subunit [Myxococcales bacterium]